MGGLYYNQQRAKKKALQTATKVLTYRRINNGSANSFLGFVMLHNKSLLNFGILGCLYIDPQVKIITAVTARLYHAK